MPTPIVIFAQVPPPEHGQSRMILLGLVALREMPRDFEVHHVNAKFSNTLEEIGDSSFGKFLLTLKYLSQALRIRIQNGPAILYYVPGPVKWSAILRDWLLLSVLRLFYSRVVFHWHAIGHGEWAHGSDRLKLTGPRWMDAMARKISAWVLNEPFTSIAVCSTSQKDSFAVASKKNLIICNGIKDPCPAFEVEVAPKRLERLQNLTSADHPCFKILFLSHGTLEKGITDALDSLIILLDNCDPSWQFQATFAGGVSNSIRLKFDSMVDALTSNWPGRIQIIQKNYLTGEEKHQCFVDHDIFLAPSRWESFGLTICEAMAYGMQIVATASDGVQGVLPENHPYLSPVLDATKLAKNLQDCCEALRRNPQTEQADVLRKRFLSKYQINHFSENFTSAFLNLRENSEASYFSAEEETVTDQDAGETPTLPSSNSTSNISPSLLSELSDLAVQPSSSSNIQHPTSKIPPSPLGELSDLAVQPSSSISISISIYLADQNPGHDRSLGISRMSKVVLREMVKCDDISLQVITSRSSQQGPGKGAQNTILPWSTRSRIMRLLTDQLHPVLAWFTVSPDIWYFPKGFLPRFNLLKAPTVVTVHDTIIQHHADHYPLWRKKPEYAYWARMLRHTLRHADVVLTVSEHSRDMILAFMARHKMPEREITVTYEPCVYEAFEQPVDPPKSEYVLHLASREPHKRSHDLIRWWAERARVDGSLPVLELVGNIPPESWDIVASNSCFRRRPFLDDEELRNTITHARALILPSEIEGFGLPAIEAYYLGTPVCFTKGTSVEEILEQSTSTGSFDLDAPESLWPALEEVLAMPAWEIHRIGLELRVRFKAEKIVGRMIDAFRKAAGV